MRYLVIFREDLKLSGGLRPGEANELLRRTDAQMEQLRARGRVSEWGLRADGRGGAGVLLASTEAELAAELQRAPAARAFAVEATRLAEPGDALARLRARGAEAWEAMLEAAPPW